ncbi:endonuclease/exonuclease/phosphatase (EEP) superfamily protein YafD [Homoserinimonas aerilata]|uniref:Endonuclease/exonuclease/phosphatase (EEP) superfamily protein YafD n=1 Tax=Homoserinimonas aerilata TaxID=1162970 RepID=A0A542YH16_9MICO|nr:endonuclease/exonuclease/phosphatase family protein [Homoserinimonas aerilata]TQL47372.1 endonuclease/exonuclease/phosphatase (EEP) superfamily protein YafD [Homoserinimonas aerilata]
MFRRLAAAALILVTIAVLLLCAWPQLFGLQRTEFVAQIVSLRGSAVAVAVVLLVVLLLLALLIGPFRRLGASLAVLLLAFAAVNTVVLVSRGAGALLPSDDATTSATSDGITVLSWNTLGPATTPQQVADLAVEQQADVVVLPETRGEDAIAAAVAMREAGRPMWVSTRAYDLVSPARSTSLLVSAELGEYTFDVDAVSTSVLPTIVASPVDGSGPTIIAVHAVAPIPGQMDNWRADLAMLADMCAGDDILMAGDFNATIDHFQGLGRPGAGGRPAGTVAAGARLGDCADAAALTNSAALGTWPTALPSLLGAPIDHVMVTDDWEVTAFSVIEDRDRSGSDHRPVVARLLPRG